ncbi:MAG: iron ABC transporter permease [Pseudomonadota bacterium]
MPPIAPSTSLTGLVRRRVPAGRIAIFGLALFTAAPIVAVLASLFTRTGGLYLASANGLSYLSGTLTLCLLVGGAAILIGAASAALVTLTEFPGRRFLSIALVLPFAIPSYIVAYTYADLLSPFGALRGLSLPEIRNLPGVAFILTLGVYPYVYLAMRADLSARSDAYLQAARSLGAAPGAALRRVIIPLSRPALAGGLALALMETAADYGVADYFGVKTLSTGIFRTWYGLGDLPSASQLAAGLFLIAMLLVLLEQINRRGRSSESARALRGDQRIKLSPVHAAAAAVFCLLPIHFGFLIPVITLLAALPDATSVGATRGLGASILNTGLTAGAGAVLISFLAIILAYAARNQSRNRATSAVIRIATLGYALPGAVIAIGILTIVNSAPFISTVSAGVFLLIYAYTARFLTIGYNSASSGLSRVSPDMEAVSRSLGASPQRTVTAVHFPLCRSAIVAGALIIFIDIAKELPATLLLRPFDYETVATRVYRLASDERLTDASPAALALILIGSIAVFLLEGASRKKRYAPKEAITQSQI